MDVNLTSTLGISAYAAKKIIDIISTASTIWSIVGIVAAVVGTGAIGVGILATAKTLVKKYGKAWAAAW
ncbi:MAG: uberolysin/carnocyclin family circular bacteriocin [Helcococcus sp.]|nr:uberolysin/carnocyclin family circular bacteriocin [Helcococcus sp.]